MMILMCYSTWQHFCILWHSSCFTNSNTMVNTCPKIARTARMHLSATILESKTSSISVGGCTFAKVLQLPLLVTSDV